MQDSTVSPSQLINEVLEAREKLRKVKTTVSGWRLNGINGKGEVPLKVLPIEAQTERAFQELTKLSEYVMSLLNND